MVAEFGTQKTRRNGRVFKKESTQTGIRTQDQLVKSQLLYQLSYLRLDWISLSCFAERQTWDGRKIRTDDI